MKYFLSALIASTLLITGTMPVWATPSPDEPIFDSKEDVQKLLIAVHQSNVKIVVDDKRCQDNPGLMGSFMALNGQRLRLRLCAKNHGDNVGELQDTIRHESIHLAQYCNGGVLLPEKAPEVFTQAVKDGWKYTKYPHRAWIEEGEARFLAKRLNAEQVAFFVKSTCQ